MSKSDRDLNSIDLGPSFKSPREPKWRDDKPVYGLDTETNAGELFCISRATGKDTKTLYDPGGPDRRKLWKFLTASSLEPAINVFYNLKFDSQPIIRNLLTEDQISRLAIFNKIRLGEHWQVLYIPEKILSFAQGTYIKESDYFKRDRTWTYFDASQFFRGSLDEASREWLNKTKANEKIEIDKFTDQDYRKDKQNEISYYCEQDADLVRQLYDKFSRTAEENELPAGWPVSTGAVAEQFYRTQLNEKIKYPNKTIAGMAWDSYHGGRFEVIERGVVGETITYDINSAYPYHASKLPDPYELDWYKSTDLEDFRTGDYGFIRVKLTTSEAPIQPFAVKSSELDKLIFPRLHGVELTVPQQLFIYALDQGLIEKYEIIEGYTTRPVEEVSYPFSYLKELYQARKKYEREGRNLLAKVLKIVINSVYGKTAQIVKQLREINEDYQLKDHEEIFPKEFLPNKVDGKFGTIIKSFKSGRWFNPIIASYITANTRLQLLQFIYDNNLQYDTVMLATDSIMLEQGANFEPETGNSLGEWDKESQGYTYIIGAGVYEIFPSVKTDRELDQFIKDGKPDEYTTKARGFAKYEGKNKSGKDTHSLLESTAKLNGDKSAQLEVAQDRPISSAEALWSARDFSSIADFEHSFRHISPNMDDKRDWPNPISFSQLTNSKQRSDYREYTGAGLYEPNQLTAGISTVGEKSLSKRIYEKAKELGINKEMVPEGEWESIPKKVRRQIGSGESYYQSGHGLDELADTFGISETRVVEQLKKVFNDSENETEADYDRRIKDHYQRLEYLDNL